MKILAVDDEALQLDKLTEAIQSVVPDAEIMSTIRPSHALYFAEENAFDVAFLDVQMRGMTGVELAKLITRLYPRMNIIFVTAYNDYKADAMDLRASGYITKPVNAAKIKQELMNLRYPVTSGIANGGFSASFAAINETEKKFALNLQCFGNFDAFDRNNMPIRFERTKAKEMLAYLTYKRGSRCTSREIVAVLFENSEYNNKVQDSFRHITGALMKAMRKIGAEDVIIKEHQNYAIDMDKVSCDYYDFLKGDTAARNSYTGEFMSQYSWAKYTNAYLDSQI
ncbi:MAG: response regulator [Eubacteriales bacterium]|nr:response regulator [Eubacteriales bacterium]